jgi:shikimate dehydrogenase
MSHYSFLSQLEPELFRGRDVYAVFGNPITHSKSPLIHEQFARNSRQDLVYVRVQPELEQFAKMLISFFKIGGKGLSITVPYKLEAWSLCQQLTPRAKLAGAVNTVWQDNGQLIGDNTDGVGLVRDLSSQGIDLKNRRILILGAGGACRGILGPILQSEPDTLVIANRTALKAQELAVSFQDLANTLTVNLEVWSMERLEQVNALHFDLVINASAAGLDQQSPLNDLAANHVFHLRCFAYDLLYGQVTPFMQQALQRGCRISDGLGMLVEQAAEAFTLWRQVDLQSLDTRSVLASLRQV